MDLLPRELLEDEIAKYLDPADIIRMCSVSKQMRDKYQVIYNKRCTKPMIMCHILETLILRLSDLKMEKSFPRSDVTIVFNLIADRRIYVRYYGVTQYIHVVLTNHLGKMIHIEEITDIHAFKSFNDMDSITRTLNKVLHVSKEAKQLLAYGKHCTYIDSYINVYFTSDDYYKAVLNPGLRFFQDPLPLWCSSEGIANIKSLFYSNDI